MYRSIPLFTWLFLLATFACAQTKSHPKTAAPGPHVAANPEPTKDETYEYIRGKILSLTVTNPWDTYTSVGFDSNTCTLDLATNQPSRTVILIGNLDPNSITWDTADPNGNATHYDKVLRINLLARIGKTGGTQSIHGKVTLDHIQSVPVVFSLPKAAEIPDFQTKMTKAFTHLITLCGGPTPKEIF